MTRLRTLSSALLVSAGLCLALAACGGSNAASSHQQASSGSGAAASSSSPPATTAKTTSTPTAASTTSPTSKATTSTSTTSASGGAGLPSSGGACTAADLTAAFLNSNGAAGHVVLSFVLHNSSSSPCHTYGYPGVQFLTAADGPIVTHATRTTSDFAGHVPESGIVLNPGQEATFRMVTSDVGSSQSACVTAYGLQIIAPDDTATMKAPITSGISVCDGKATVSPLAAGTGASSL